MKKFTKRLGTICLSVLLGVTMLTGCGKTEETTTNIRIGTMSGPTGMGMVKLMDDSQNNLTANTYEFAELATDASTFVAPLSQGELDIATIPSNLASVVYNKTEGGITVLAVNTLGVLNIVERGESINSISDLAGKKIYATGEGATPEYTLKYILEQNGLDAQKDVTIQWCADTTEALSYVSNDEQAIAMLPQPFATAAMMQVEGLRIAIDLNDAWASTEAGADGSIVTGVTVVRTEFLEAHPEAVKTFMEEYEASVNYTINNQSEAATLIEKYGIVAKAPIAEKALPGCHITYKTGEEMKTMIEKYLQILFEQNPQSVGGSIPGEDFYYGL